MVPGCSYPALMLGRATKLQSSTSTRSRKSVVPRHVGTNSRATPWRAAGHSADGIDAEKTVQKHPAALHSQLHFGPRRPSTAAPQTLPWQTTRAKNGIGREYPLPPGERAGSTFGAEPGAQKSPASGGPAAGPRGEAYPTRSFEILAELITGRGPHRQRSWHRHLVGAAAGPRTNPVKSNRVTRDGRGPRSVQRKRRQMGARSEHRPLRARGTQNFKSYNCEKSSTYRRGLSAEAA